VRFGSDHTTVAWAATLRARRGRALALRVTGARDPGIGGPAESVDREGVSDQLEDGLERQLEVTREALAAARSEIAALRERAREEMREREELLTLVSHELRTPVTVIAGYNRLLLSGQVGALNDEQERFLRESSRSCQRLNGFIAELLESAVGAASRPSVQLAASEVEPTIATALHFLRPLLDERRMRVDLCLSDAPLRARLDCARIEQVLTNLISNAIKYASPGSCVRVSTDEVWVEGRRFVEVAVEDEGPGVEARDRARIFEPYVRVDPDEGTPGLGLGLAICRRIVEAHGGAIRAEARPEGGSRFAFTLPALSANSISETAIPEPAEAARGAGREG